MRAQERIAIMINRIEHIGIAVKDLEERIAFYRDVLGLTLEAREELPERKLRIAVFNLNGVHIELLEPTSPESNIATFIEKRGEGLHHIAFGDDDVRGTLARLSGAGVELLDHEPRPGAGGAKIAFLDPKSTFRVLMELCETASDGKKP
jgi:methylmalonyl-CoA/ethylmalonyl-CoA epimerase